MEVDERKLWKLITFVLLRSTNVIKSKSNEMKLGMKLKWGNSGKNILEACLNNNKMSVVLKIGL